MSLHLSKCHIVGNHMLRLNYVNVIICNIAVFGLIFMKFSPKCRAEVLGLLFTFWEVFALFWIGMPQDMPRKIPADITYTCRYHICTDITHTHADITNTYRYHKHIQISQTHTDITYAFRYYIHMQISHMHRYHIHIQILHTHTDITYRYISHTDIYHIQIYITYAFRYYIHILISSDIRIMERNTLYFGIFERTICKISRF